MALLALVLLPAAAGGLAFLIRPDAPRRAMLVCVAIAHACMTAAVWRVSTQPVLNGWIAMDAQGLVFLSITSALFLAVSVYAIHFLRNEQHGMRHDLEEDLLFANAPEAVFTGCLLLFLATMTLVTVSQHFGLLWVAIESSTLASAPLIYFHRHHRSLEATWKYLMICSVGVALALLGIFFLALGAERSGLEGSMRVADLVAQASQLEPAWMKAAFIFLLVGYGTKMGLAPLHTWLPDAHSEAPSLVSALLSGALLNCAFLGILRMMQVFVGAGQQAFAQQLLVVFGLFSIGLAAVFLLEQADYKRLLAYSSVEHMGILALGLGLGGIGAFGAMLHTVNHSFTKALLFLAAGNILAAYRSKSTRDVTGLARTLPATSFLWVAGFFAIAGSPPFGTFMSEFTILRAALNQGRYIVAIAYIAFLSLVFIGMSRSVLAMAQGPPPDRPINASAHESWQAIAPPAALAIVVLLLGFYVPPALNALLHEAARSLGGM
ncbi:MAG TPA: proton-conducting transporter membrane subunit [Candidatus Hydrogenedentes bacterium]|nr:proton-conducting transporter membrane subunit [Candidatus Hydrogenedentota bacterium]